jgi:hypothetical protein
MKTNEKVGIYKPVIWMDGHLAATVLRDTVPHPALLWLGCKVAILIENSSCGQR